MEEKDIKTVTRILKDHIQDNQELVNKNKNTNELSETVIASIEAESTACANTINFIETIDSYLKKWSQQLKISGVNSKAMVLNDIQFLLKEKENK